MHEKVYGALFEHVVPAKGVSELCVEAITRDLDSLGVKRITCRTDGENPITALLKAVKMRWNG